MKQAVREWLPDGIAGHSVVRGRIEAVVADWSQDWFARRRVDLASLGPERPSDGPEEAPWEALGTTVLISRSRAAELRMAALALDEDIDSCSLNLRDCALLAALERRMMQDFASRLEAALPVGEPPPTEAGGDPCGAKAVGVLAVGGDRLALMRFAVPVSNLASALKASLPRRIRDLEELIGRRGAIAPTAVVIEARAGKVELSLPELRMLAPGDVLVLDRPLSAGVEIGLAASRQPLTHAKLIDADGDLTLVF